MTQEESLNDSENKSIHEFHLKVKNPGAEESSKPKLSPIRLHKFNFFYFSYLLCFFPPFSYVILFLLPAQCACSVAFWETGFVIPVCSIGFVDLLGTVHPTDCRDMRTPLWYWHTAEIRSPATTAGFHYGEFCEVAHHCSQDPFPLQLMMLGPSARLPEQEVGKEPPKGQSSTTHSGRPERHCLDQRKPINNSLSIRY